MDKYKYLALAIKQARLAKGFSQEEFAELLDVSSTHVKHMESGHRKPSIEILFLICEITGLSLDRIIKNDECTEISVDEELLLLIDLCTKKEKQLFKKIVEAVISNRDK